MGDQPSLMEIGQASRAQIQLDRHDEPREVRVRKVFMDTEEVLVEYPNTTSRIALMGDIRERVPHEAVVSVL